MELTILCKKKT